MWDGIGYKCVNICSFVEVTQQWGTKHLKGIFLRVWQYFWIVQGKPYWTYCFETILMSKFNKTEFCLHFKTSDSLFDTKVKSIISRQTKSCLITENLF